MYFDRSGVLSPLRQLVAPLLGSNMAHMLRTIVARKCAAWEKMKWQGRKLFRREDAFYE